MTKKRNLRFFTFLPILTLLLFGAAGSVTVAPAAQQPPPSDSLMLAGFSRLCGPEPVFNGNACIYQANTTADKTVVLVHGINGEAANWYHQLLELRKDYHVLTFDLPGFGRSSKNNELYSPTNYAHFVDYVVSTYAKKGKFHLIGHSLGGAIALRYAALFPDKIGRMILADVAGILHRYAFTKSIAFKWLGMFEKISYIAGPKFQDFALDLLQQMEELPIDIKKALSVPQLREIILRGNSTPIAGAALVNEDFTGAVYHNAIPTLIVWGNYDMVTPLRSGKILRSNFQHAYLEVLPEAAHSSMFDAYKLFNQKMMAHFRMSSDELEKHYWHATKFVESGRQGSCKNQDGISFEGAYKNISIENCQNVEINNAQIASLVISSSQVNIEDSTIQSEKIGITATAATVTMTNVRLKAMTGFQAKDSELDIAGSQFNVGSEVIHSLGNTAVVFSICKTDDKPLHKFARLGVNELLFN